MSLSGFALLSDYEQECSGAVTFTGHGVFTFNSAENLYAFHWFDCMGSPPEVFLGPFDGNVLTLSHGGPGIHGRMTYDLRDFLHLLARMEMSQDGMTWSTVFEGNYKRLQAG